MMITPNTPARRAVLRNLAGGAVLASAFSPPGLSQVAAPPPRRRNIADLGPNDPILQTFRDGVARLKALPSGDRRRWDRLAAIHGTSSGFNLCPHGNWFFLPWHRAYLVMYERLIRNLTGEAAFALPYWDWTTSRGLPQAFAAQSVGGRPNPLWSPNRQLGPGGVLPDDVVGPRVMADILNQPVFEIFGSTRPQGQTGPGVQWVRRRGSQGPLESNPHNEVHGRVAGLMASGGSPLDPVFLLHHGNIDRVWAAWNGRGGQNPTAAMWLETPFTDHFLTTTGAVWSPKVAELTDTASLGYSYAAGAGLGQPLPSAAASQARLEQVLGLLHGTGAGLQAPLGPEQQAERGLLGRAPAGQSAAPGRPASVRVPVVGAPLAAAAGSPAGLSERQPTRILAFVREISPPAEPDITVRVFLNLPSAGANTTPESPHFVGTFGFFGGAHGADHQVHLKSVVLDATAAVRALTQKAGSPPRELTLTFVPSNHPGQRGEPFRIGEVAIAVI